MTTPEIYIPKDTYSLKDVKKTPRIRLGIQGFPGTGKTFSALTAPNPIVANFDDKLSVHVGRDIPVIPFNEASFINDVLKIPNKENTFDASRPPNKHIGFIRWLKSEGLKLTENQTLITDSLSSLLESFDVYWAYNPVYGQGGVIDKWAQFKAQIAFMSELVSLFKSLKCHVILTAHETVERDDEGRITSKVKPLITGQFADKIAGNFSDWYRMHAIPKKDAKGNEVVLNGNYKLKEDVEYFWQVQSDNVATCCCSVGAERKQKFVRADFKRTFIDRNFEL